ncbi:hypothetical protein EJC47_13160 [Sphingomonas sp. TF3]|uniref:hypothetical protein n=1 Tax=Sphingomonas sp. TF3 TaxID=2495580 RepID=UPI000F87209E|nr:hypothetical protein [Sphingomonas sp. TF3]RUN76070.1 hypothetical protein EJC47_13160 [Sphingomonas sp. TF3]
MHPLADVPTANRLAASTQKMHLAIMAEQSKRERIILFGVIPVLSAISGSIATVIFTRAAGSGKVDDAIVEILRNQSYSAEDKTKLLTLANASSDHFWSILSTMATFSTVAGMALAWALADWIRRR